MRFLTALGYHFEIVAGKTNKVGDTRQPRASPNSTRLASRIEFPTTTGATHPRRTAQARVRDRAVERRQVHGQATRATQPGMANLLAQPRGGHCRHGLGSAAETSSGSTSQQIPRLKGLHVK